MGRKVDMKKIEDITKCQVTFSKRRSSLMKKAHEISVCCDVDVAFITFSPSGRVSKFCSQRRIEDVIHRYINLPADRRYTHIKNVQEKQEKLRQLDHIKGDTSKLQYLDKQVENLELQIKKSTLELQILEADIRDYEPLPEQEPSLHQLMWCERNLKQSLERVVARKNALSGSYPSSQSQPNTQVEMEKQDNMPFSYNIDGRDPSWVAESPPTGQLIMQLDPWISPYSAKVRESIFQGLVDQAKRTPVTSQAPGTSTNHSSHISVKGFPTKNQSEISSITRETLIPPPLQQSLVDSKFSSILSNQGGILDSSSTQNHLNKQDILISLAQSNSNQGNGFASVNHSCSKGSSVTQPPNLGRSISLPVNASFYTASASSATTKTAAKGMNLDGLGLCQMKIGLEKYQPKNDQIVTTSKWFNPKTTISQHKNVKHTNQCKSDCNSNNNASSTDTKDKKDIYNNIESGFANADQSPAMEKVDLPLKVPEVSSFDNLPLEDIWEDNKLWTRGIQESGLWEWDDLVMTDNLNLEDLENFF